jgi:hypothetical protein
MCGKHVIDAVAVFIELIVDVENLTAGVAEYCAYALLDQSFDYDL